MYQNGNERSVFPALHVFYRKLESDSEHTACAILNPYCWAQKNYIKNSETFIQQLEGQLREDRPDTEQMLSDAPSLPITVFSYYTKRS